MSQVTVTSTIARQFKIGRHRRLMVTMEVKDSVPTGRHFFWFWCPGCSAFHSFITPTWLFNGDYQAPTFSPRLELDRCHLWLQSGMLTFGGMSRHNMVGRVVPLPALPDDCFP